MPKTGKEVGIDLGIKTYATMSDFSKIENPKYKKKVVLRLKSLQRKYSKAKDNNLAKERKDRYKRDLRKAYEKVNNKKEDFLHKESTKLVKVYDIIVMEKLDIKGMLEKKDNYKNLNEEISNCSWGKFTNLVKYKAESADKELILVNPKNTSKECSNCGNIKQDLKLSDRIYYCDKCNTSMDRDLNASINIYKRRLNQTGLGDNPGLAIIKKTI